MGKNIQLKLVRTIASLPERGFVFPALPSEAPGSREGWASSSAGRKPRQNLGAAEKRLNAGSDPGVIHTKTPPERGGHAWGPLCFTPSDLHSPGLGQGWREAVAEKQRLGEKWSSGEGWPQTRPFGHSPWISSRERRGYFGQSVVLKLLLDFAGCEGQRQPFLQWKPGRAQHLPSHSFSNAGEVSS